MVVGEQLGGDDGIEMGKFVFECAIVELRGVKFLDDGDESG